MDALLLHPAELLKDFFSRGGNGLVTVSSGDEWCGNGWCRGRGGWLIWGCLGMCGRGIGCWFGDRSFLSGSVHGQRGSVREVFGKEGGVRGESSQVATVTLCGPSAAIDPDHVAVIWQCFHHCACFGPFSRLARVAQVLNGNCVTRLQRRERPGMGGETFLHACVTLRVSLLAQVCFKSPLLAGLKPLVGGW